MKKLVRNVSASVLGMLSVMAMNMPVFAAEAEEAAGSVVGTKAIAAAIAIAVAAAAGAIAMGWTISKSAEGASKQPEATSKIQTLMMLGLVFIETAIIYALIVAILIIFVL